jgi:hypothetical protein
MSADLTNSLAFTGTDKKDGQELDALNIVTTRLWRLGRAKMRCSRSAVGTRSRPAATARRSWCAVPEPAAPWQPGLKRVTAVAQVWLHSIWPGAHTSPRRNWSASTLAPTQCRRSQAKGSRANTNTATAQPDATGPALWIGEGVGKMSQLRALRAVRSVPTAVAAPLADALPSTVTRITPRWNSVPSGGRREDCRKRLRAMPTPVVSVKSYRSGAAGPRVVDAASPGTAGVGAVARDAGAGTFAAGGGAEPPNHPSLHHGIARTITTPTVM